MIVIIDKISENKGNLMINKKDCISNREILLKYQKRLVTVTGRTLTYAIRNL